MGETSCILFVLVSCLGSPEFRTREAAHCQLASLGWVAQKALERAAPDHPDHEVRRRCRALWEPFLGRFESLPFEPRTGPLRFHFRPYRR
jgi:hypothetical protein